VSQKKLAQMMTGLLALPGLVWAGYPDVARSQGASDAVAKVAQIGAVSPKGDGRFHGEQAATRYDLAVGLAKVMAQLENRMIQEGRNPEDIVPYIERINLYVADEIDHLKQSQKEVRALLNELLERMDRRDRLAGAPPAPPAPPRVHPYRSSVPQTDLGTSAPVRPEQRIYTERVCPPLGAAVVHESATKVTAPKQPVLGSTSSDEALWSHNEPATSTEAAPVAAAPAPAPAPPKAKAKAKGKKSTSHVAKASTADATVGAAPSKDGVPRELAVGESRSAAHAGEPTDEELANWKPDDPKPAASAAPVAAPAPMISGADSNAKVGGTAGAGITLTPHSSTILQQMRNHIGSK
jgi:hypothetical protein